MKKWRKTSGILTAAVAFSPVVVAGVGAALGCTASVRAQQPLWSERVADSAIARWPGGNGTNADAPSRWSDEPGVLLEGMDAMWYGTADRRYYAYVKQSIDRLVQADGSISTYDPAAQSVKDALPGRELLLLYRVTQDKRYYKAASMLREQVSLQRKDGWGGHADGQGYSGRPWLGDLYMAEPFDAEYASVFGEPEDFREITRQFALAEQHVPDLKTGLQDGRRDRSERTEASSVKGESSSSRASDMGWYMMALVDTLPYYAKDDPGRTQLIAILNRTARVVARYQDKESGLWYEVPEMARAKGNDFDSTAACMFTYALAKGVRRGYLPVTYEANAERGWKGIRSHFLQAASGGQITSMGTARASGPDGRRREESRGVEDGWAPAVRNDPEGVGLFLLAAGEMELNGDNTLGRGTSVLMDGWYNNDQRKNAAGKTVEFHYKWDDYSNPGFSLLGHIFRSHGTETETLYAAPTLQALKGAEVYVIVSPDNLAKSADPHYMNQHDAEEVAAWVKQGGTLLLMENDPANADITHMDLLADIFGLHFNNVLTHHVIGDDFGAGRIDMSEVAPPFTHPHKLYMKDTCSLTLSGRAVGRLTYRGDILMASATYGKGLVFAVADPWLYNEYTDGRKLPAEYDNFAAGQEWVRWLLERQRRIQVSRRRKGSAQREPATTRMK